MTECVARDITGKPVGLETLVGVYRCSLVKVPASSEGTSRTASKHPSDFCLQEGSNRKTYQKHYSADIRPA